MSSAPILLGSNSATFRHRQWFPAPALGGHFRAAAARSRSTIWSWSANAASRSTPASPPPPGTPITSTARPVLPICIACARWSMRWWSAWDGHRRRSAIDRPAGRGPEPGAGRHRSERAIAGDARGCWPPTASAGSWSPARRARRSSRPASRSCRSRRTTADCAGRDPRRARRARLSPHSDRRRRRDGLALPGRRLPRPAAHRGRADHPRLRPVEPHAAADRAGRRGDARADPRAHVLGDEVLLDCDLSAQRVPIGRAKMST